MSLKKAPTAQPINGVAKIIAVASGKGGVGKSTIAVNIAATLASIGYKTALVDADIHGPSIPIMLGIDEKPDYRDNKIIPVEKHGIKAISMGMLIDKNTPTIWRGPMLGKALHQLTHGVDWQDVDFMIMDLPPGLLDLNG